MATKMTFGEYDDMVITDENGKVNAFSFTDNMGVLEDALEEVTPEHLENIRNYLYKELETQGEEVEYNAFCDYTQSIKELLQKNWDAVYAIAADDLE